jgi:prolyl-tRNA synthetase
MNIAQDNKGMTYKKETDFAKWYKQIVTKSELIEYYDISGCYILRPWSYRMWEIIQSFFDKEIKKLGVKNAYFPLFVSKTALIREENHIKGFSPEVAWVTKGGKTDLETPIAIRPTSETGMYPAYAKWIKSYRDLPLCLNQWNNVVRWEFKDATPFIRSREFLWQEGHSAFSNKKDADKEVLDILELYKRIYEEFLCVPVIKGKKTEKEKFAGGDYTMTIESYIPAVGKAIQCATSHSLGQNFAKMFDITFLDSVNKKHYVWQNSWGMSTRTLGVMIMTHSDNKGLILPPKISPIQIVIIPIYVKKHKNTIDEYCKVIMSLLYKKNIRYEYDDRDHYKPGWKYNYWELKGVPLRMEIGLKDIKKKQICIAIRHNGKKFTLPLSNLYDIDNILNSISNNMLMLARKKMNACIKKGTDFWDYVDPGNLIINAPFCCMNECEENIKYELGIKSLCIPLKQDKLDKNQKCFYCQDKNAVSWTLFGRSY